MESNHLCSIPVLFVLRVNQKNQIRIENGGVSPISISLDIVPRPLIKGSADECKNGIIKDCHRVTRLQFDLFHMHAPISNQLYRKSHCNFFDRYHYSSRQLPNETEYIPVMCPLFLLKKFPV